MTQTQSDTLYWFKERVAAILEREYDADLDLQAIIERKMLILTDAERSEAWALYDNMRFWNSHDKTRWGILVVKVAKHVANEIGLPRGGEVYECLNIREREYNRRLRSIEQFQAHKPAKKAKPL
jgi:hypothetical protein